MRERQDSFPSGEHTGNTFIFIAAHNHSLPLFQSLLHCTFRAFKEKKAV